MSQNIEAFHRMEKGAGVRGLVVRPLSGRLLPPTIPEEKGLIRREDLLDIRGRSRQRQMALAAEWGIESYPQPAGGCRLTVPQYAERVFTLAGMGFKDAASLALVRHGRLFPLNGAGRCCWNFATAPGRWPAWWANPPSRTWRRRSASSSATAAFATCPPKR